MNHVAMHREAVDRVAGIMAAMGIAARPAPPKSGHQLVSSDGLRVRVLVARESVHRARVRYGARVYSYPYRRHEWNLHRHGRLDDRWDVGVLVVAHGDNTALVVPREEAPVKVVHRYESPKRGSKWDRWVNAWVMLGAVEAAA